MTDKLDVKSDFEIFKLDGDFVYFDSASTTLVPKIAVEATTHFLNTVVVSSRRGAHRLAVKGGSIVKDVRETLTIFLKGESSSFSFQKSIPSAIASLVYGYDWKQSKKEKIIISQNEDNSVYISLLRAAEVLNLDIDIIPLEDDGTISLEFLERSIDEKTGIVAIGHTIPGIGTTNPISKAADIVHKHNAILLTDATRSVGLTQDSPVNLGCDVLVFSANIGLMAPPGLAIQWITPELGLNHIPGILGGTSVSLIQDKTYETAFQPHKFESGYINIPAIAGLGAAIEYLSNLHEKDLISHMKNLSRYMKKRLLEIPSLTLYGNPNETNTIFGFNLGKSSDIGCHDIALFLDESNIAVRSGYICAHPIIQSITDDGLIQVSMHAYNSIDDVDRLADTLVTISEQLM
ncbi:MAG: aminotransferase class V-fold PLP-dependent enzyme [Candidatus Thorarchaeota archaeon]|nr:MAG: aminotransferase class V-fold PLP-dependent enzyme [Candidatus Thorarchaeota archaeon]